MKSKISSNKTSVVFTALGLIIFSIGAYAVLSSGFHPNQPQLSNQHVDIFLPKGYALDK